MSSISDLIETIWNAIKEIWHKIVTFFIKVLNFILNIINWFYEPQRIKIINEYPDVKAVVVREKLESGDYRVINGLFNTKTNKFVDAVMYQAEELDERTKQAFRDKDMIILQ